MKLRKAGIFFTPVAACCYAFQYLLLEILLTRRRPAHRLCYANASRTIYLFCRIMEDPEGIERFHYFFTMLYCFEERRNTTDNGGKGSAHAYYSMGIKHVFVTRMS